VKKSSVLVLGVAYKKDVNDYRESPALEILTEFLQEGAHVTYSDPFVPEIKTPEFTMKSQKLTPALLKKQACVILVTDHSSFDYRMILKNAKLIFDTRNALRSFRNQPHLSFL
jgi:UDP-N-acetyl-D-glucosamine dehydrogenase